jgi:hypothetical protein
MAVEIKITEELVEIAKLHATVELRSAPKQIEYWSRIGEALTDNPNTPMGLIQDIMRTREEVKAGLATPYKFG